MTGIDLTCYSCVTADEDPLEVKKEFTFDSSPYRAPVSKPTFSCSAQPIDVEDGTTGNDGNKLESLDLGGFSIEPFSTKEGKPSEKDPSPTGPEGGAPTFNPDSPDTELCEADANRPAKPSSGDDDEDHTLAIVIASVVGGLVVVAGIVYIVRSRYAKYEQIA
jgi:hypothetical protein